MLLSEETWLDMLLSEETWLRDRAQPMAPRAAGPSLNKHRTCLDPKAPVASHLSTLHRTAVLAVAWAPPAPPPTTAGGFPPALLGRAKGTLAATGPASWRWTGCCRTAVAQRLSLAAHAQTTPTAKARATARRAVTVRDVLGAWQGARDSVSCMIESAYARIWALFAHTVMEFPVLMVVQCGTLRPASPSAHAWTSWPAAKPLLWLELRSGHRGASSRLLADRRDQCGGLLHEGHAVPDCPKDGPGRSVCDVH